MEGQVARSYRSLPQTKFLGTIGHLRWKSCCKLFSKLNFRFWKVQNFPKRGHGSVALSEDMVRRPSHAPVWKCMLCIMTATMTRKMSIGNACPVDISSFLCAHHRRVTCSYGPGNLSLCAVFAVRTSESWTVDHCSLDGAAEGFRRVSFLCACWQPTGKNSVASYL